MYKRQVLVHRNQLVSLGKHTRQDDILVIAMCHIQHEDELLLHIGIVQRIVCLLYTSLPAGTYTFKVKITNNDKSIVERENSIRVIVKRCV